MIPCEANLTSGDERALPPGRRYKALNVQAGMQLCDGAFEREVATGKLSSSSLDDYTCIALAGVATEYLRFGRAEGGNNDVLQLDAMLKGLRVRANDCILRLSRVFCRASSSPPLWHLKEPPCGC